jgi:hypothetical protein
VLTCVFAKTYPFITTTTPANAVAILRALQSGNTSVLTAAQRRAADAVRGNVVARSGEPAVAAAGAVAAGSTAAPAVVRLGGSKTSRHRNDARRLCCVEHRAPRE